MNIYKLKQSVDSVKKIKPIRIYRGTFLSEDDIKKLRIEAKKINEAYRKSWIRARDVYVR
jgi:hypothetical protein